MFVRENRRETKKPLLKIWKNPNFKSGEWKKNPQDSGGNGRGIQLSKRKPPVQKLMAASVHRTLALKWVRIFLQPLPTKKPLQKQRFLLAEDEGFEPPQTESESGVLPLHKSSIWEQSYYIHNFEKVKNFFPKF